MEVIITGLLIWLNHYLDFIPLTNSTPRLQPQELSHFLPRDLAERHGSGYLQLGATVVFQPHVIPMTSSESQFSNKLTCMNQTDKFNWGAK